MPLRRRRVMRRRPMRKMRRAGKRTSRLTAMKDRARVVEVYETIDFPGQTGGVQNFTLAQFDRALAVSKNYRYYRAKKVELEFIPFANVFPSGQAFPELYYQQDYTAWLAPQAPDQNAMLGRGVLPIKWTKAIKKSYTPAVLRFEQAYTQVYNNGPEYYVNDVQPITATPVKNRWYMTQQAYQPSGQGGNPSVVYKVGPAADPTKLLYTGSAWFVNTPVAIAGNIGRIFVRVHWEFKEPFAPDGQSSRVDVPLPQPIDLSGNTVVNIST